MTKAMQMVLNQFIEDNASEKTMSEVMCNLYHVLILQKLVDAYRETGQNDWARLEQKNLEKTMKDCSKILLQAGIEYTIEDILNL